MRASARKQAQTVPDRAARTTALRKPRGVRKNPQRSITLGGLERHLGYFVRRVQVWVFQDFIRSLREIDISPAQYSVLLVIDSNAGLSQSELARTLGIQRARMVRVLHKLDRRGLTRRLQSSADGRTNALRLTTKGQATLRRAQELAGEHEARLVEKFGAESYGIVREILRGF